jgi:hypothetical protein
VVTERLDEGDHLALVEDRDGGRQVGKVADGALGEVDVVVVEDVAQAWGRRYFSCTSGPRALLRIPLPRQRTACRLDLSPPRLRLTVLLRPPHVCLNGRPKERVYRCFGGATNLASFAPVVRKPAKVTFEQAATAPIAVVTALQALRDDGRVQPGGGSW